MVCANVCLCPSVPVCLGACALVVPHRQMAAVFNCLVAVHGVCMSLPWLTTVGGAPPPLHVVAPKLLNKLPTEALCQELTDAVKTVSDSVTELREVFAAGTGLNAVRASFITASH
jgi:hypothetical protein